MKYYYIVLAALRRLCLRRGRREPFKRFIHTNPHINIIRFQQQCNDGAEMFFQTSAKASEGLSLLLLLSGNGLRFYSRCQRAGRKDERFPQPRVRRQTSDPPPPPPSPPHPSRFSSHFHSFPTRVKLQSLPTIYDRCVLFHYYYSLYGRTYTYYYYYYFFFIHTQPRAATLLQRFIQPPNPATHHLRYRLADRHVDTYYCTCAVVV